MMKKISLKGGSLSRTSLIIENKKKFVRKEVSLKLNREYGYQRWYSQLKRIQRYNKIFPKLFPELIDFGLLDNKTAYFDITYIDNSLSGYDFLLKEKEKKKIEKFHKKLVNHMSRLHNKKFGASSQSIHLYLFEEVEKKIKDCMTEKSIINEMSVKFFNINGNQIPNIIQNINTYKKIFISNNLKNKECFTHGNITLENMLYNSDADELYFIDPYDENVIDSKLAEYSQILQSSNSKYEYLNNNHDIEIESLDSKNDNLFGINYFNILFNDYLEKTLTKSDIKIVKLFEISQFIRMLPFKLNVNKKSMLKFTKVASVLLQRYIELYE
jgi:hypothetical protein